MAGRILFAVAALCALIWAGAALGQTVEEELAEKWSPVLKLKEQEEMCGPGEPYEPIDVDVLFDNADIAFRGPWDDVNLVAVAPAADNLSRGFPGYHLDFPGDALNPGCTYEEWGERLTAGQEPTMYARVVTEEGHPGQLALQYWFFYIYNDFNNKHEGDWEMIQLHFDAANADDALSLEPTLLGYSQHEGAESAELGDEKLELIEGTHPVVYPASGSHANFFTSQIFLGRSAAQGVGCDDTNEPSRELRPAIALVPTDPDDYLAAYPWLGFEGHWGELQPAFFNGPTGPNSKPQWTKPISWAEESWRDQSFALPGGDTLLPEATTFFCEAVGAGSALLTKITRDPQNALFVLIGLLGLLIWALTRTTWTPGAPLRLHRRRAVGQVLHASRRMYGRHFTVFAAIGLVFIPIGILVALLQAGLFLLTDLRAVDDTAGASNPVVAAFVFGMSLIFNLIGLALVQAVVSRTMITIDEDRSITAWGAYRQVFVGRRFRKLVLAVALIAVVVMPLTLTFFLIPVGVWILVRWSLTAQAHEIEELDARASMKRSSELVRGSWWRTGLLVAGVVLIAATIGPLIGALAILGTDAAFWVANLIAAMIYVFAFPFVAIVTTYLYFDLRVSHAQEVEGSTVLPAEAADDVAPQQGLQTEPS